MLIRSINDEEINDFVEIQINSYPRENVGKDEFDKIRNSYSKFRENSVGFTDFIGLFEDGILKGCMILYKYDMTLRNSTIKAGGIGSVAVHMLYRKQKVCKRLVEYAHDYFSDNGIYLSMLYPFSTEFYLKMGYGFGPKKEKYELRPSSFPNIGDYENVRFLDEKDADEVMNCYQDYYSKNSGLCRKHIKEFNQKLSNKAIKSIGYLKDGKLTGYCFFKYNKASINNFIKNDIEIIQLVYNDQNSLNGILKFFANLRDQINRIILCTQDDMFYHIFSDPRDGSDELIPSVYHKSGSIGVGIMYRIIDFENFINVLSENSFGEGDFKLKISLKDSFREKNNGEFYIDFSKGNARLIEKDDSDLNGIVYTDMAILSSMLTGSIDFKSAYRLSKISIGNGTNIENLRKIIDTDKPICLEDF